jgi:hypothetical protein
MPRISPHPSLLCGVRQISTYVAIDRGSTMPLSARKNALLSPAGWAEGLRPSTRFFSRLREFSLARERGNGKGAAVSPFSSFHAPLTSLPVSSHLLRIVSLTVELRRWRLLLRSPSTARALGCCASAEALRSAEQGFPPPVPKGSAGSGCTLG